jgi:hypothetical protein
MPEKAINPNATQSDWARLAAFIDGEGCINIHTSYKGSAGSVHRVRIQVANTDARLPHWVIQTFGVGHVYVNRGTGPRPVYFWEVAGRTAQAILRACLSHFVIKREQAEIALRFHVGSVGKRLTVVERDARESLKQNLMQLKRA